MNKTLAFTGIRDVELTSDLANRLHDNIENYILKGCDTFISGGAVNSDTWFFKSCLKHKEKYPHIKLIIYQPHPEQDKLYNSAQKEDYKKIIENADEVVLISEEYSKTCFQLRNMQMVNRADYLLSIYDFKGNGGTHNTIEYGKKVDNIKEILIIKP